MAWLILTHAVALALFAYAPFFWIKLDSAAFVLDGSADSFHTVFHRQRLTWRVGFAVVVAVLASLPPLLERGGQGVGACFVSVAGLLAIGAGWHAYVFNPGLNVARALAYVPKYYVSFAANAARFPDRWIRDRAYLKAAGFLGSKGTANDVRLLAQQYAPQMLKNLLRWTLFGSVAIYAAAAFLVFR